MDRGWCVALAAAALALAGVGTGVAQAAGQFGPLVISCAGDQVTGTVEVTTDSSTPVALALLVRTPPVDELVPSGRSITVDATPGTRTYTFSIPAGGLPLETTAYQVAATTAVDATRSNVVSTLSCSPGTQIPEAPAQVLVPLVMLGVAGIAVARQRRSAAEPA